MADWYTSLACPACGAGLTEKENGFHCDPCARDYAKRGDAVDFLSEPVADLSNPDAVSMVKNYREPNRLMASARRIITSEYFPGRAWREARERTLGMPGTKLIIGSGVSRYPDAIHLDIDDFPGVDIIADGHRIPLADNTVTGVLCEVVLEHVARPDKVVAETLRVLKPGGRCFFIAPFLFPFHGQPNDYRRWSREGLLEEFSSFGDLEVGIHGGPCSAMVHLLSEWMYVLTGLTFPKAYMPIKGTFTALLLPAKFLDIIVNKFPEAHRLAATLYVTGVKPGS
ncbi:MAG: methyltransferase domain-containing protein [Acidobacteriota bacterium]|nr:methyltransferase domain-containing protein [Acidobacteriota bacterium]